MVKTKRRPPPHLPPVETRFQKGVSGNPGGRKVDPIKKALRNLTRESFREVIELALTGNVKELRLLIKDPTTTAIQLGVATSLLRAIQRGDWGTIEAIATRIVGKIPDELKVTGQTEISVVDARTIRDAIRKVESDL